MTAQRPPVSGREPGWSRPSGSGLGLHGELLAARRLFGRRRRSPQVGLLHQCRDNRVGLLPLRPCLVCLATLVGSDSSVSNMVLHEVCVDSLPSAPQVQAEVDRELLPQRG
jgi:hypothetical protein